MTNINRIGVAAPSTLPYGAIRPISPAMCRRPASAPSPSRQTEESSLRSRIARGDRQPTSPSILQATIWLSGHRFYDEMNAVWEAGWCRVTAPARVCVESSWPTLDYALEIQVVAAL